VGCIDVSLRLIFECSIEEYLRMDPQTGMLTTEARLLTSWLMLFIKCGQSWMTGTSYCQYGTQLMSS
jgi:hypothetical protein